MFAKSDKAKKTGTLWLFYEMYHIKICLISFSFVAIEAYFVFNIITIAKTYIMATFEIKRILVPVDFSEAGEKAIDYAVNMAKINGANITLAHIAEGASYIYDSDALGISKSIRNEYEVLLHDAIKMKLEELKGRLVQQGVKDVEYYIETGKVYKKIIELAESTKTNIVIMGTHGVSGLREFIIGSNTFRVVGGATCPVLSVQNKGKENKFRSILLPFKDKAHSRESVDYAVQIAKLYDGTVHLLGINTDPDLGALKKMQFEAKQTQEIIESCGVKCRTDVLTGGYVSELILSFAENKQADLIAIVADLDKMAISEYVSGPVVQQIVNHSQIPVLSVHPLIKGKLIAGGSDWSYWA
jgi:nucleotide-binding universal stress UspA family protein